MNSAPLQVLVTGANGFIGSALCPVLLEAGILVHCAVRRANFANRQPEAPILEVGDISEATDWTAALRGIDCVVHLAARSHVLREISTDPLAEYRRVNVDPLVSG